MKVIKKKYPILNMITNNFIFFLPLESKQNQIVTIYFGIIGFIIIVVTTYFS